jgi:hypothetical protein
MPFVVFTGFSCRGIIVVMRVTSLLIHYLVQAMIATLGRKCPKFEVGMNFMIGISNFKNTRNY